MLYHSLGANRIKRVKSVVRRRKKKIRAFPWGRLLTFFILTGAVTTVGLALLLNFIYRQTVEVPDIKDKDVVDAIKILNSIGLHNIQMETRPSNQTPEGYVIAQEPEEKSIIRAGRIVRLLVSEGLRQTEVPKVIGVSLRRGEITLRQLGLSPGMLAKVHSDEILEGVIIAQSPPPQIRVARESQVNLLISKGPKPVFITMPRLVGENIDRIEKILETSGISIGFKSEKYFPDLEPGVIIGQDPAFGTKVEKGAVISLEVNRKPDDRSRLRYSVLRLRLPFSLDEQRVKVLVSDEKESDRMTYEGFKEPVDILEITLAVVGQAKATIYVNEKLFKKDVPL